MALDRRARLAAILERDGAQCVWCRRGIDTELVAATTEHLVPKIKGGPSWLENEVAACRRCNGERGHRTPAEWVEECRRRGWDPAVDVLVGAFESFQVRVARDGGARRARPYVDSQLRRLRRMDGGRA
ncbi:MAG TPA: HNH endonuclease [Candidatus Nanopelagicales bacterium]|nr:HNH endonuclease [Candidatus Nanopelagicales bacterium]